MTALECSACALSETKCENNRTTQLWLVAGPTGTWSNHQIPSRRHRLWFTTELSVDGSGIPGSCPRVCRAALKRSARRPIHTRGGFTKEEASRGARGVWEPAIRPSPEYFHRNPTHLFFSYPSGEDPPPTPLRRRPAFAGNPLGLRCLRLAGQGREAGGCQWLRRLSAGSGNSCLWSLGST